MSGVRRVLGRGRRERGALATRERAARGAVGRLGEEAEQKIFAIYTSGRSG